ncbi:TetR/AcrR family transcriptional regulator [Lentzea sp. NPDC092896]|uniref:TetR/AcrR family transcriptional regulator n=1 Tax=Lentzea sp. NPDC092896 TaxID=3364127 RepID=UPI003830237F
MAATGAAAQQRITPGVFFTPPTALPRGRHELSREDVVTSQRERMLIAATEILAAEGFRGVGVREICAHAAVSRTVFYGCFADKDACVYAAYDRFIAVLIGRMSELDLSGRDWSSQVSAVLETYLATLQQDLVAARAFQVEMDGVGREARARRRDALHGMATFMRAKRVEVSLGAEDIPFSAYVGAIYAVRQICSDTIDSQSSPDLLLLLPDLTTWVGRMLGT